MKKIKQTAVNNPKNDHDNYLDILKGLAIVLVVFGHSIQTFAANGDFDNNILFRVIYSFHMPLFMFLSGAAAAYSSRPMNLKFMERKFYQLVIPFIAWIFAGYLIGGTYNNIALSDVVKRSIVSPDFGLWFLWVLFLSFCALSVTQLLYRRLLFYSYPIVWLVIYALPTNKYGIGMVKWYLPFFFVGYLIYKYKNSMIGYRKIALSLAVLSFPILALTWHRLAYPSGVTWLEYQLIYRGLSPITVGDLASINISQFVLIGYKYAVAFSGIGFCYWLFALRAIKPAHKLLSFFGVFTLDIYVTHAYFFRYTPDASPVFQILSSFFIAITLSWALGYLLMRRIDPINIIFLGGRTITSTSSFLDRAREALFNRVSVRQPEISSLDDSPS